MPVAAVARFIAPSRREIYVRVSVCVCVCVCERVMEVMISELSDDMSIFLSNTR